jgi:hypothetical protein
MKKFLVNNRNGTHNPLTGPREVKKYLLDQGSSHSYVTDSNLLSEDRA